MAAFGALALWSMMQGKKWEAVTTGLVFLSVLSGVSLRAPKNFWVFGLLLSALFFVLLYKSRTPPQSLVPCGRVRDKEGRKEGASQKQSICVAGGIALLALQAAWLMNFLPLHPISFSAVLALIYLVTRRVMEKAWNGALGKEGVLKECLVFSIIILLILGTTSWNL